MSGIRILYSDMELKKGICFLAFTGQVVKKPANTTLNCSESSILNVVEILETPESKIMSQMASVHISNNSSTTTQDNIYSLVLSNNGQLIATCSQDGRLVEIRRVILFPYEGGNLLEDQPGQILKKSSLSPQSADKTMPLMYSIEIQFKTRLRRGHYSRIINSMAFSDKEDFLMVTSESPTVHVFALKQDFEIFKSIVIQKSNSSFSDTSTNGEIGFKQLKQEDNNLNNFGGKNLKKEGDFDSNSQDNGYKEEESDQKSNWMLNSCQGFFNSGIQNFSNFTTSIKSYLDLGVPESQVKIYIPPKYSNQIVYSLGENGKKQFVIIASNSKGQLKFKVYYSPNVKFNDQCSTTNFEDISFSDFQGLSSLEAVGSFGF